MRESSSRTLTLRPRTGGQLLCHLYLCRQHRRHRQWKSRPPHLQLLPTQLHLSRWQSMRPRMQGAVMAPRRLWLSSLQKMRWLRHPQLPTTSWRKLQQKLLLLAVRPPTTMSLVTPRQQLQWRMQPPPHLLPPQSRPRAMQTTRPPGWRKATMMTASWLIPGMRRNPTAPRKMAMVMAKEARTLPRLTLQRKQQQVTAVQWRRQQQLAKHPPQNPQCRRPLPDPLQAPPPRASGPQHCRPQQPPQHQQRRQLQTFFPGSRQVKGHSGGPAPRPSSSRPNRSRRPPPAQPQKTAQPLQHHKAAVLPEA
mmetsp:Transcript_7196/g.21174  ORF Transcript_7196/g.21174 Transcript_7196/m.21174 type:complete len:307 (+) Transcript_7196:1181-2101(+)